MPVKWKKKVHFWFWLPLLKRCTWGKRRKRNKVDKLARDTRVREANDKFDFSSSCVNRKWQWWWFHWCWSCQQSSSTGDHTTLEFRTSSGFEAVTFLHCCVQSPSPPRIERSPITCCVILINGQGEEERIRGEMHAKLASRLNDDGWIKMVMKWWRF